MVKDWCDDIDDAKFWNSRNIDFTDDAQNAGSMRDQSAFISAYGSHTNRSYFTVLLVLWPFSFFLRSFEKRIVGHAVTACMRVVHHFNVRRSGFSDVQEGAI